MEQIKDLILKVIDEVYYILRLTLHDTLYFPSNELIYPTSYAATILALSGLSAALKAPYFTDWRGALVAVLILTILTYFSERSEINETTGLVRLHTNNPRDDESDD